MSAKISLSSIERALRSVDAAGTHSENYRLSRDNLLPDNWWVTTPYGKWPIPGETPVPSPFEQATLKAVDLGRRQDACFIDIAHLGSNPLSRFFDDPKVDPGQRIVSHIGDYVSGLPPDVAVQIRYLEGSPDAGKVSPAANPNVRAFFGEPRLTKRANAYFYYGNYAPSISVAGLEAEAAPLLAAASWLLAKLEEFLPEVGRELVKLKGELVAYVNKHLGGPALPPLSWNHGKIFALNGTSLTVGGINFWNEYQTGSDRYFDLSMLIAGGAANDGHRYTNYLWSYLNSRPMADVHSFGKVCKLANGIEAFAEGPAPMFPVDQAPAITGHASALAVANGRRWPKPDSPGVPSCDVLVFDAIRDIVLNMAGTRSRVWLVEGQGSRRAGEQTKSALGPPILAGERPKCRAKSAAADRYTFFVTAA